MHETTCSSDNDCGHSVSTCPSPQAVVQDSNSLGLSLSLRFGGVFVRGVRLKNPSHFLQGLCDIGPFGP